MTFQKAKHMWFFYLAMGILASVSGFFMLLVTTLKSLYVANSWVVVREIAGALYYNLLPVEWLWPWMSEFSVGDPFAPTIIAGFALIIMGTLLFKNATRLKPG
jgi:hypothetical protein